MTHSERKLKMVAFALAGLMLGVPVFGVGALSGECQARDGDEDLPELKKLTPKLHKVEPYKAGVQQNAFIEAEKARKARKAKKKKRKRLKVKTKKSDFRGKQRSANLDNGNLQSSIDATRLNSNIRRGIGIIGVKFISMSGKPPIINRVFPGTPAAEVGLRPRDRIVAVDGIPTSGLTKEECYDLIVGSPNTPVTLSIRRGSNFKVHTMNRMDFTELLDPSVRRAYGVNL